MLHDAALSSSRCYNAHRCASAWGTRFFNDLHVWIACLAFNTICKSTPDAADSAESMRCRKALVPMRSSSLQPRVASSRRVFRQRGRGHRPTRCSGGSCGRPAVVVCDGCFDPYCYKHINVPRYDDMEEHLCRGCIWLLEIGYCVRWAVLQSTQLYARALLRRKSGR